jgi:Zn finger protein HypA/HybF involved in hydrogenase expression
MAGFMDKIVKAAMKAGTSAQENPRLFKAALNVKKAVDAFREGYRENAEPEANKALCPHCEKPLPPKVNYCPNCGAKVD